MKRTAFISHSSKDKAIADEVCRFLEENGVACWIAPRDVIPGKNYGAAIVGAIDECDVFVLILTGDSNKSGQVVREVERAASSDSVIIPFRIDPVLPSINLEFYVSSSHWLDATKKPLTQHLGKLLDAVKNWQIGREIAGAKEPGAIPTSAAPVSPGGPSRAQKMITIAAVGAAILTAGITYLALRQPSDRKEIQVPPPTSSDSPPIATTTSVVASPKLSAPRQEATAGSGALQTIKQVTASSELAPEVHRGELKQYEGKLAFDGNETTAWMPTGGGTGQWIMANLQAPLSIKSVSVYGGAADANRYEKNNRVKTLRVILSDGTTEVFNLEDKMKAQRFVLKQPVMTEWIKFEILAVYPGTRHDSTPISEIAFNSPE